MLPADPTLSVAERVDAACDRFESEWKGGVRPKIDDYVAAAPESDREELRQALLALEVELQGRSAADTSATRSSARADGKPAPVMTVDHVQNPAPTAKAIGRFELRGVLGSGAFGKVYRAFDPQLGREVALKVPLAAAVQSEKERAQFLKEARSAAAINHPNVCQVHEVGEADGRPYIVMALVRGQSLADTLKARKEPLPEKQAALVARKIALALAAAHDSGIVHRDLKPANVMFDRERKDIVVMDFGLARGPKLGDARGTQSGVIMGTPAYMSPEQARGDSKGVGPAGDIFSLGVILYELLTGTRPFTGTATEVIGKILHVEPKKPSTVRPGIDPRLESACLKAMAKDPAARFASMKEFAAALDAVLRKPAPTGPAVETARANTTRREGEDESTSTRTNLAEVFAALSDDRKQARVETAAAVEAAIAKHRTPRWIFLLVGLFALSGFTALAGIVFFTRSDTVKVDLTIVLKDVDLADKSLTFILDDEPISADTLAKPVELKPGVHIFTVKRGKEIVKRVEFRVEGGRNPGIKVEDITPPPVPTRQMPVWTPLIRSADELVEGETTTPKAEGRAVKFEDGNLILQGAGASFFPKFSGRNYILRAQVLSLTESLVFTVRRESGGSAGYHGVFHNIDRGRNWPSYVIGAGESVHWWGGIAGTWQRVADEFPAEFAMSVFDDDITLYVNGEQACVAKAKELKPGGIMIGSKGYFSATLRNVSVCVLDGTDLTPNNIYPQKLEQETVRLLAPGFVTEELKNNNLLKNPGFEDGENNWRSDSGGVKRTSIVKSPVRSGKQALQISADWWDAARAIQTVAVKPNRRYLFSGWIKTDNIRFYERDKSGAHLFVEGGYRHRSANVPVTADWTYYAVVFHSGDQKEVKIEPALGHFAGTVMGTAWYDDLCLIEIPDPLPPPEKKVADDGFVPLFNGKDFAGWNNPEETTVLHGWVIKEGAIVRDKANPNDGEGGVWQKSNLWTQGEYGDFVLELEFLGKGTNTLVIRADQPNSQLYDHGLHVPLNLRGTPGNYWLPGTFYPFQGPKQRPRIKEDWNHMRLTAVGPKISVELNGETINEIDLDRWAHDQPGEVDPDVLNMLKSLSRKGHIGFNAREGDISLRNLRIKQLHRD